MSEDGTTGLWRPVGFLEAAVTFPRGGEMTTESTPTETFESKVSEKFDEAVSEGERMLAPARALNLRVQGGDAPRCGGAGS